MGSQICGLHVVTTKPPQASPAMIQVNHQPIGMLTLDL